LVSAAVEPPVTADLPEGWERLERAVDEAVAAIEVWRARALEAEAEVVALRGALESAVGEPPAPADPKDARDQLRRLRAENAALRSRISQAHRRISGLLAWTDALGGAE
jgi:hypothetical protein